MIIIYACLKLSGIWVPHGQVRKSAGNKSMMFGNSTHDASHRHAANTLHQALQQVSCHEDSDQCPHPHLLALVFIYPSDCKYQM